MASTATPPTSTRPRDYHYQADAGQQPYPVVPDEVARAMALPAGDDSSFMTGATLAADGGQPR